MLHRRGVKGRGCGRRVLVAEAFKFLKFKLYGSVSAVWQLVNVFEPEA
jgi:hypothetical protein